MSLWDTDRLVSHTQEETTSKAAAHSCQCQAAILARGRLQQIFQFYARYTRAGRKMMVFSWDHRVATALSRDRWAELKPAEGECT
ncbi:hypothetical protein BD311DRAFT_760574 [Dichomitus squalens]|uniref:Uncharacterized protein n=1 Tax=Dichomitus squalens TaxID=114155 RepID=A0A4Q9MIK5_9APHY|nr:hypothetical protein BD311DRAFT_760574 [Dichomitus squalens]